MKFHPSQRESFMNAGNGGGSSGYSRAVAVDTAETAAATLGKEIRTRSKEGKVIIRLK
jgi:hypothetical protein